MISVVSSRGWDSLKYLFFAQRSVFIDKCQHLYSLIMFHLEVESNSDFSPFHMTEGT